MFLKRCWFLNLILASGIIFHSNYALDLKNRKQIYEKYVSLNKFEGKWIDPHSLGIFDGDLEFEELGDSYTMRSEEIMINEEKTWKSPESFSGPRIFPRDNLQDDSGISNIFVTGSNAVFSMVRNLTTVSAVVTFLFYILFVFFPKTMVLSFMLILSTLWHWMKLYQEKIAEKQNLTENLLHPNECHRSDLHWYEMIYLYILSYTSSQTECKEYYKAVVVDPFWEVSIPMAMMNAFTSTICEPMKVFATTVRFCFDVLFAGVTVLKLTITLFSIFIFLLMNYGYSLSFCWGAIHLSRPKSSVNQTPSQSLSCWGLIIKKLKSLLCRDQALVYSSELSASPDTKNRNFCNEDIKIKVSDKQDAFKKNEISTDKIAFVKQKANLHSGSLHLEKNNHAKVALKITQFRKCHKKSFSC